MGGIYDLLELYRQQNDPRFVYEGLYEQPAYTGPNIDPMYDLGARQFGNMNRMNFGVPQQATSIMQQAPLDMNKFEGVSDMSIIDETTNDEQDQEYIDQVNEDKENGIIKLLRSIPTPGNLLLSMLPEQDPRATGIRNFYRPYEGLTSSGSIASGIMKGYNPVSGGFLNMITGGKFGKPTQYGLAGAMQRRIENILGRRAPQTDASRAKVQELRNLQRLEIQDRADRGESLGSIGRSTFTGPGMAFEKQDSGTGKGPR